VLCILPISSDLRARLEVAIERVAELGLRVAEQPRNSAVYNTTPASPVDKTPPTSPIDRATAVSNDEVLINQAVYKML